MIVFAKYLVNRLIDLFVAGPASVAVALCFVSWVAGESPFRNAAAMVADAGEAFRDAPAGYVHVVQYPAAGELPALLSDKKMQTLPRKLVPVSEWISGLATTFFLMYLYGVSLGLLPLLLLRGWSFFKLPEWPKRSGPH